MTDDPELTTETDTHQAPPALEHRFRRLLRAYPYWYRRRRGDELLATLLEGSADDQERPTPSQRRDIIRSGLKCRLRVRGRLGATVVAVLVALTGAVLGSWVGAWLAWLGAPDLPDEGETATIATVAFGGVKPDSIDGDDALFTYDAEYYGDTADPAWVVAVFGGYEYGPGQRIASFHKLSEKDWKAIVPRVGDNLTAAGWHLTEFDLADDYVDPAAGSVELTAFRDGHVITVEAYSDPAVAELSIARANPPGFVAGWIGGAVAGLLAGWLFAVRIAWQVTVVHPTRSAVVLPLLSVATILGFFPMLAGTALTIMILNGTQSEPGSPPWWPVMTIAYRPPFVLAVLVTTVGIVYAMAPRRRAPQARHPVEAG